MRIIKRPEENPIEITCAECNTLFSYVWPEVQIVEYEKDASIANWHRTGFLKGEYIVNVYKCKKTVVYCPCCQSECKVEGYSEKALRSEKIGERALTKQEIKDGYCTLN